MAVLVATVLTGCNRADTQAPGLTLSQAGEALSQVRGYHVRLASPPSPQGQVVYDLAVRPPDAATGMITFMSPTSAATTAMVRFDGHSFYGQGQKFAESHFAASGVPVAAVDQDIGNRWFKDVPEAPGGLFGTLTNPGEIAKCLTGRHGTLRVVSTSNSGGGPDAVIADSGDGQTIPAMRYAVASSGAPYPLLITQTGDAGASPTGGDACHLGNGVTEAFSDFGVPVSISLPAPGDFVDVSTLR